MEEKEARPAEDDAEKATHLRFPLAEVSFTWGLKLIAEIKISRAGDESIEIQQETRFGEQQEGNRGTIPGGQIEAGLLMWRLQYLERNLQARLEEALEALNCEAIAFTDFIAKVAQDFDYGREITIAFHEDLATRSKDRSRSLIDRFYEDLARNAKKRLDNAVKEHIVERYQVVKGVCDGLKAEHDLRKAEFDLSRGRRISDPGEWETVWVKTASRKQDSLPNDILRMFSQGQTSSEIAKYIVGLELGFRGSSIDTYLRPSARKAAKEKEVKKRPKDFGNNEVFGIPTAINAVAGKKTGKKSRATREKRASKNPVRRGKKGR